MGGKVIYQSKFIFMSLLRALRESRLILIAGAAVFVLYVVTMPSNRGESIDGFWYAAVVENTDGSWTHRYHMLYFPLLRFIDQSLVALGWSGRAYERLVIVNAFMGAVAIIMYYFILRKKLDMEEAPSIIGSLLLASSYGFWRWTVDVEITSFTIIFSLCLLYLGLRTSYGRWFSLGLGSFAGMSILIHGFNALLAVAIIPLRLFIRSGFLQCVLYAIGAAVPLFSVYWIGVLDNPDLFAQTSNSVRGFPGPSDLLDATIAVGRAVVAGNFVWGSSWIAGQLQSHFYEWNLREEIFMGAAAPRWMYYASVASFVGFCTCVVYVFVDALKLMRRAGGRYAGKDQHVMYLFFWLVVYMAFLVWWGMPDGELATPALVPLWSIFVALVVSPLWRCGKRHACIIFVVALFVHNAIGGVAWVWLPDGDYHRARGTWLVDNASREDLIITADRESFTRWLRYWSEAKVVNVCWDDLEIVDDVQHTIKTWKGNVYVMDDVFEIPFWCHGRPTYSSVTELSNVLKTSSASVGKILAGTIYILDR